jgi:hypothetical protein
MKARKPICATDVIALLQRYGPERLFGPIAEQLGTFGVDALVIVEGGGAAAIEVMGPDDAPSRVWRRYSVSTAMSWP